MSDIYTYEVEKYSCKHCGWSGYGKEVVQGEMFNDGFEVNCPKCCERFPGLILFPLIDEAMKYGSETDKIIAKATKGFQEKWLKSLLKNINQLPELHYKTLTFVLREIEEGDEKYIVITERDEIIWKEILCYEYYERFIEIGKLLKEKYGNRMIDFVPDVNGLHLYGDRIHSLHLIEDFRKELRAESLNN